MRLFVEAAAGSDEKGIYDESTLALQGVRRVRRPYPYPYGFVIGTRTDDGDALDCYLISRKPFSRGSVVECEPIALLEFYEDDEVDHKILAAPIGELVELDEALRGELKDFILAVFSAYPEMSARVGALRQKEAALRHIELCRFE